MNDAAAIQIVREAWRRVHGREPTPNEVVFATAVARLETGYGRVGQHGELAARGLFNWGNIEHPRAPDGGCPPGMAPGIDAGREVCFEVFASDVLAAERFVWTLTRRHWPTIAAMASGSPEAVARAMKRAPAYYSGAETEYAAGLRAASAIVRRALEAGGRGFDATIPVVALALLAWWLLRRP